MKEGDAAISFARQRHTCAGGDSQVATPPGDRRQGRLIDLAMRTRFDCNAGNGRCKAMLKPG